MKKIIILISATLFSITILGCDIMQDFGGLGKQVRAMYPGAVITEIDRDDNGCTEVEFTHDKKRKEVTFDSSMNWLSTTWDVHKRELPAAVQNSISTEYAGWRLDDADFVETPSDRWYDIELEKGGMEVHLRISTDGTIR